MVHNSLLPPTKTKFAGFFKPCTRKIYFSEICETGSDFSSSLFKQSKFYYNHFQDTPNSLSWQDKEFGVSHEHNLLCKMYRKLGFPTREQICETHLSSKLEHFLACLVF